MTPAAWAVQLTDGRIDYELVGPQRQVEWWCSSDEGRAAGRRPVPLFIHAPAQPAVTLEPDILAEYTRDDGRRQHVHVAADLYRGDVVTVMEDPRMSGRWYVLGVHGDATVCVDQAEAIRIAAEHDRLFPGHRPHRAVRMAVVEQICSEVAQSAEQRPHKPQGAGSSPALATNQEQT